MQICATVNELWAIDEIQKVSENALPTQTRFPSSHINQILPVLSYPGCLSWFQVSLKSVEKCVSCGGRNFGLPIDLAHRLYNSLLLPHKPWWLNTKYSQVFVIMASKIPTYKILFFWYVLCSVFSIKKSLKMPWQTKYLCRHTTLWN